MLVSFHFLHTLFSNPVHLPALFNFMNHCLRVPRTTWSASGGQWGVVFDTATPSWPLITPCCRGFMISCCYGLTWPSRGGRHLWWFVGCVRMGCSLGLQKREAQPDRRRNLLSATFAPPHGMAVCSPLQPSPCSCVLTTVQSLLTSLCDLSLLLWGTDGFLWYLAWAKQSLVCDGYYSYWVPKPRK